MSDPLARRLAPWADRALDAVGLLARGPAHEVLLEAVRSFGLGLRAALEDATHVDAPRTPIAYEGLGMGATLLDAMRPREPARLAALMDGPYPEFVALGAGMAIARVGRTAMPEGLGRHVDAGWNGWGFQSAVLEPLRLRGAVRLGAGDVEARVGAGRALWFLTAGDADAIVERLARVERDPRRDLWRGVGTAAAFAGGATPDVLARLTAADSLGAFVDAFAQAAATRSQLDPESP